MRTVELFYLPGCPYCVKAKRAQTELKENPVLERVRVRWIDESEERDYADEHNYYYVPTFYVGEKKVYEARPGSSYDEIRDGLKAAMSLALEE